MVKTVFGPSAFPANYDSALYVNFYDISQQFDINDLQLLLSLSHLVQNEIMSDLTPVYSSYKVSTVDENELKKLILFLNKNINSNSNVKSNSNSNSNSNFDSNLNLNSDEKSIINENDDFEDEKYNSEELKKLNEKNLKIILLIIDYIRENAKRKWCQINTVLLANDIGCTPSEIVYCVGK